MTTPRINATLTPEELRSVYDQVKSRFQRYDVHINHGISIGDYVTPPEQYSLRITVFANGRHYSATGLISDACAKIAFQLTEDEAIEKFKADRRARENATMEAVNQCETDA